MYTHKKLQQLIKIIVKLYYSRLLIIINYCNEKFGIYSKAVLIGRYYDTFESWFKKQVNITLKILNSTKCFK